MKKYFNSWTMFEKIWLLISTLLILGLSLYWQDNIIGITAGLTGIWCVVLVAKGRITNYYVGIVNVIAYAWVAYTWQYYGEVMLNMLYFLPMQFVGLWLWKSKMTNKEVIVKIMTAKQRLGWIAASIILIFGYGLFLKYLGGNLPFIDSTSTVLSVIAMVLMAFRYMEQWVLWIVVNIASIGLWVWALANGGTDMAVLLMWTAYLVNAIYGLYNWNKMYQEQENYYIWSPKKNITTINSH